MTSSNTLLNFPINSALKSSTNMYQTMKEKLPLVDLVVSASAFISWVHRMTNEEIIAMDIYKNGKYYPVEVFFHKKIRVVEVLVIISNALEKEGVATQTHQLLFSTEDVKGNESTTLQFIKDNQEFSLWGSEKIINSTYSERYLTSLSIFITDFKNNENLTVTDLSILTPAEISLWNKVNNTKKDHPNYQTMHEVFSKTAEEYPNNTAISSAKGSITFQELDSKSNQVANYLVASGISIGDYVAVYMERSIEAIASMLGVMKAGGVYVPLSPENPKERNAYIMENANTRIILTDDDCMHLAKEVAPTTSEVVHFNSINSSIEKPNIQVSPQDIAYIIYTSGSTGKPKGVKIPHKSILTFGYSELDIYELTSEDVLTQFYTLTFDASMLELCPMIITGARLHMLTKSERLDVSLFAQAIKREGITSVMMLPMSVIKQFSLYAQDEDAEIISKLRYLGLGGEALTGETVRAFQDRFGVVPIINIYGPTECSVQSTFYMVTERVHEDVVNIPIGKPLNNYKVYIVDEQDNICPLGVAGELLIETDGISDGYLNLPEKTAEVFVKTKLSDNLMYRSGDIVKMLEDGNIEFVGRKDTQVKIRGYRVELGEIEDALLRIDFVEDGAIVAKDVNGDKTIVGYYTLKEGSNNTQKDVLDILATKLPKYMIPSFLVELEDLPLLPSGKINRKVLESLPLDLSNQSSEEKKEPSNEVESKFLKVWKEVLGLNSIGVDENFFEIGGHSLKVLAILSKLKKEFPTLKINDFFTHPTIELLAQKVEKDKQVVLDNKQIISKETALFEHPKQLTSSLEYKDVKQTDILLTGATGYLGAHILIDLLENTEATIYTLVRATSKDKGLERIKETLAYYVPNNSNFLKDTNALERVIILTGDFSQEGLGLSEDDKEIILTKVNSIIHCGADVRHFGAKEEFTKTNVDSTKYLLDLAILLPSVRFHYVSTIGIPEDLATEGKWDAFLKEQDIAKASEISSVYSNSKLESEKLVEQYYKEGLPVTIYRPGNISCQYETGLFQKNIDANAVYRMLKGFILLGKAPDVDYMMDFTMVDYASRAITEIALDSSTNGKVYNICNSKQVSYKQFIAILNKLGYTIDLVTHQEYVDFLYSDESKDTEGLELAMAGLEGDGAKNSPLEYKCPQTEEVLLKKGIASPIPDTAFFQRMLEHAHKIGYIKEVALV